MCIYHPDDTNNNEQQILDRIFQDPLLTDILWTEVIELLARLQGATITKMSNSVIYVKVPHPVHNHRITNLSPLEYDECVDKHQVRKIREFLIMLDIRSSEGI